jgi:hypothetical protein
MIAPMRGKCVSADFLDGVRPKVWLSDRLPAQCRQAEAVRTVPYGSEPRAAWLRLDKDGRWQTYSTESRIDG